MSKLWKQLLLAAVLVCGLATSGLGSYAAMEAVDI